MISAEAGTYESKDGPEQKAGASRQWRCVRNNTAVALEAVYRSIIRESNQEEIIEIMQACCNTGQGWCYRRSGRLADLAFLVQTTLCGLTGAGRAMIVSQMHKHDF